MQGLREKMEKTSLVNKKVMDKLLMDVGFNTEFKCSNELLTVFGLSGKYMTYAKKNKSRLYCPGNFYTCCSDAQIENSMTEFGHAAVNLKKNLEPMIELAVMMKTINFINRAIDQIGNPVCSVILNRAFKTDTRSPEFNAKKFFKNINL